MPDEIIADLRTRVAVLEVEMSSMKGGQKDILETQKGMAADLHAIRETIATGRGAWWAAGAVLALLAGVAGGAGAFVHKITSG